MRRVCIPQGLAACDVSKFETIVVGTHNIQRGEALYRAGEACSSIYAVRSGAFKSVMPWGAGREQVGGLHLPGDPVGLDGIGTSAHARSTVALEDSSACIIPYAALKALCRTTAAIQDRLHRLWGEQLVLESFRATMLSQFSSTERVVAFLLDLSARHAARGYSRHTFNLRMTREDIGSYLGMTLESASRTLGKLQKGGLIGIDGKDILVFDLPGLQRYLAPSTPPDAGHSVT